MAAKEKACFWWVFWGIVLILFNINIGFIDILSDAAGYLMIAYGLNSLPFNVNNLELDYAKKFSIAMIFFYFIAKIPIFVIPIVFVYCTFNYFLMFGLANIAKVRHEEALEGLCKLSFFLCIITSFLGLLSIWTRDLYAFYCVLAIIYIILQCGVVFGCAMKFKIYEAEHE